MKYKQDHRQRSSIDGVALCRESLAKAQAEAEARTKARFNELQAKDLSERERIKASRLELEAIYKSRLEAEQSAPDTSKEGSE